MAVIFVPVALLNNMSPKYANPYRNILPNMLVIFALVAVAFTVKRLVFDMYVEVAYADVILEEAILSMSALVMVALEVLRLVAVDVADVISVVFIFLVVRLSI